MQGDTKSALAGFRVAEIGGSAAAAWCGKLFADFGASVVKLEPPGGDPERRVPPLVDRGDGARESAVFAWMNTNKQSITLPPGDAAPLFTTLAASDLLIDSRSGAGRDPGPTGHDALRKSFPGLDIVAISWFGDSGPYRDFVATDSVVRALAGLIKQTGPKAHPLMQPDHQAMIPAGLCAFTAASACLLGAAPRGRRFEISIHDANVVIAEYQAGTAVQWKLSEQRRGVNRWFATFPMGIHRCREGWIGITINTADQWRGFCDLLDMPDALANPEFATGPGRFPYADELEARFAPKFLTRTAREWFAEGLRRRLPFVIVPDMADLLAEPIHRQRGAIGAVRIGGARFEAPVLPQHLRATPPVADGIAPLAGQHSATWHPAPAPVRARNGNNGGLPLAGVRIIDLCMGWAGPVSTRQMADLGAEVIKVEGRAYPDWWRGQDYSEAAIAANAHEMRLWFNFLNRNKLGITLDLTQPEGADMLRRLVATADAVVENYSQGVLPKLGLDYANLSRIKPGLVMVSMPAFGADTAWADMRAYGSTLEQGSGLPQVTGEPDGPPTMVHLAYGDPIGGLNSAASLMAALLYRKQTGQGQHVDLSQIECLFPFVGPWIIEQSLTGKVAPRRGNRHPVLVPHGVFPCAGEDSWIVIAVTDDAAWQSLCRIIGRADLAADPALATADGRRAAEERIEAAIAAWTQARAPDAAMAELQATGVAAGVARGFAEVLLREPHLQARGFWQTIDRPFIGPHPQPSATFREEGRALPIRFAAPTLGQYTRDVLRRILDIPDAELDRLEAARIIGTAPIPMNERRPRSAAVDREYPATRHNAD